MVLDNKSSIRLKRMRSNPLKGRAAVDGIRIRQEDDMKQLHEFDNVNSISGRADELSAGSKSVLALNFIVTR
jgi:hypothetical protein